MRPALEHVCGSKRRARDNYFSERICYMFLISRRRGDWDLCICTFCVLAKREPLRSGDFRKKMCFAHWKNQNLALRSGSLYASAQKCTGLDRSLLYILILGTPYGKFARKNNFLTLGVCFPEKCSSASRMFATSQSRLYYYWRIVSFPHWWVRWNVL